MIQGISLQFLESCRPFRMKPAPATEIGVIAAAPQAEALALRMAIGLM